MSRLRTIGLRSIIFKIHLTMQLFSIYYLLYKEMPFNIGNVGKHYVDISVLIKLWCVCIILYHILSISLIGFMGKVIIWTASSEFGTYRLCEQRRFRRACASAQSRQNLRYSLIQPVNQEEPSDRKPDPWPLWMAGHAQLKFVMTECSKTQIRLTRSI